MMIASPEFPLAFFPFIAVYWFFAGRPTLQKILLLGFGYLIYASLNPWFALSILLFTAFVWVVAEFISRSPSDFNRNIIFFVGVSGALSYLGFFKYFNFLGRQLEAAIGMLGLQWAVPLIDVLLPLGISFYVFQAISYLHGVRYETQSNASPLDLSLYLCFLPTLLAGPICRPCELLPQLQSKVPRTVYPPEEILLLISLFLFKKVLFASWLARTVVDPVFADPASFNAVEIILAIVAYSFQIYFDFSGYTDLANAAAMLLGYRLPPNFSLPYLASSLTEFWGRWHISLSRWIRDYIYIPLGGNRKGLFVTLVNLMAAMVLSGLWHGASLNYLAWGAFHGFLLCLEKLIRRFTRFSAFGIIPTFSLVSLGWVLFRAPTLDSAFAFYSQMFEWRMPLSHGINHVAILLLIPSCFIVWKNSSVIIFLIDRTIKSLPLWFRPVPFALFASTALALSPDGMPNFIYAQF